jgi:hypothetical protein
VAGDLDVAHGLEQRLEPAGFGVGELDELEAVGAGDVGGVDLRFRGVVRERSLAGLLW